MGDDLGGDLGDDLDLGGDEGAPADAGAADDVLLATPGRREDRHEGAPYEPVKHKKSAGSAATHSQGAMKRELKRMVRGPEAGTTPRTKFPGKVGIPDMKALVGLEENLKPTYTKDEHTLFENTNKVRMLVEQMESKEVDKDEA